MVKVVDRRGVEHRFDGKRMTDIIQTLMDNAGEIAKPERGQLVIDFSGSRVSASIHKALEMSTPEA